MIPYHATTGRCWNCFDRVKLSKKDAKSGKFLCKKCKKMSLLKKKCTCSHEQYRHSKINLMCLVMDCKCQFFVEKPKKRRTLRG